MLGVLLLLVVPIIGITVSSLIISDANRELEKESLPSVSEICAEYREAVGDICDRADYLQLTSETSMLLIATIFMFFILVAVLSKISGSNRRLNSMIFPKLVPMSLLFIGCAILIEGIVITYALFELQVFLMERWFVWLTGGIGLGAAAVGFGVLSKTFSIKTKPEINQRAVIISDKGSEIWRFVSDIAEKTSSPLPDNIALGLEPNFYATGADVFAMSDNKKVSGETLYMSLPLMRLFSKNELAAVVGHELGHFKGGDAVYTLKFAPVYRALSEAMNSAAESGNLMSLPAIGSLTFLHKSFENNEKAISRLREFEADKIGSQAASAEALVQALVKLTVFSGHWSELQGEVIANLKQGRPVDNLSLLYSASVSYDTDREMAMETAKKSGEAIVAHPTDSHPSTGSRAEALGVGQDTIEKTDLCISDDPSIELLENHIELEEKLSLDEQKFYIALGVGYESEMPEGENPYGIARIGQTAAALMVCADGIVDLAEIEQAEGLGSEKLPNFNRLEFRELCLNPDSLPDLEEYATALGTLPPDFVQLLIELLEEIANADGKLDKQEAMYLKKLKGFLKEKN